MFFFGVGVPTSILPRAELAAEIPKEISRSFAEPAYDLSLIEKGRIVVGEMIEILSSRLN